MKKKFTFYSFTHSSSPFARNLFPFFSLFSVVPGLPLAFKKNLLFSPLSFLVLPVLSPFLNTLSLFFNSTGSLPPFNPFSLVFPFFSPPQFPSPFFSPHFHFPPPLSFFSLQVCLPH